MFHYHSFLLQFLSSCPLVLHTEVGVTQVLVDDVHDAFHQCFVWRLNFQLLNLVILALLSREFVTQCAAYREDVQDGTAQDVHVERFHYICVCTSRKTLQLILLTAFGSQEYHWDVIGVQITFNLGAQCVANMGDQAVITLDSKNFELFDAATNAVRAKVGNYEVYYGNSSADKNLKKIMVNYEY